MTGRRAVELVGTSLASHLAALLLLNSLRGGNRMKKLTGQNKDGNDFLLSLRLLIVVFVFSRRQLWKWKSLASGLREEAALEVTMLSMATPSLPDIFISPQ